jgi:hypothetical protein
VELNFDGDGQWSNDYRSYMLWATLDGKERIRCQLTWEMLRDCCGVKAGAAVHFGNPTAATDFAEKYRITFISALKRLAAAGGFSPGDDRYDGRQLILTSRNFLPAVGTKNPFIDGPAPDAGAGLAGHLWDAPTGLAEARQRQT